MRKLLLSILVISLQGNLIANDSLKLNWELAYSPEKGQTALRWIEASVPGAVQLDIAKAEGYGPYYFAENWKDYLWMEDREFIYRSEFSKPEMETGQRLIFHSLGIDYKFEITLNGEKLLEQEGMFTPVRLDLTGYLAEQNELLIKIFPVPKLHRQAADRSQAAASFKPAVSYGWDWHPRLVPLGIWDETYLEVLPGSHVEDVSLTYILNDSLDMAKVRVFASGRELEGCSLIWKLMDDTGNLLEAGNLTHTESGAELELNLNNPILWWPHDHGTPYLYNYSLELSDRFGNQIQTREGRIGFRRVKLVMNEGAWREPLGFPKTRSVPPIQLEINGRKIFCKGSNWVNPEIFPGLITYERYEELLDRALETNFNMLRIWGGGIVNKEAFHQLCDEKGLLVWQEFPLACNNYVSTPEYMAVLEKEAESIIKRIRKHPSLAMWSGGNELFNSWSGMTDQSLALRLLNSLCLKLDPNTPYINTSPLFGMGHGHYVFRDMDTGEEVYSTMNRANNTAYTEFGMPSPSSVDILRSIIPEKDLWPPRPGTSWESHHAYYAWVGDTWLMQGMIEDYFGKSADLEELVTHGQILQCEGYKAIYEEARRQKPYCSMALNWCYNEPWPTAANNSLLNWPNLPKPGFYAVRDACRPVTASARNSKLQWVIGEEFTTQLWMLNDKHEALESGVMHVKLVAGGQSVDLSTWEFESAGANTNIQGPEVSGILPEWEKDRFSLILEVEGHPEYNSSYIFLLSAKP